MSTESDALDRGVLERKARDELQQIATALGVTVGSRAKKADIVNAILGESPASPSPSANNSDATEPPPETTASDAKTKVRRTRVRSTGGHRPEVPIEDGPVVPEPKVKAPDVDGPTEEPKAEWEQSVSGDGDSSPSNEAGDTGDDNASSRSSGGRNANRGDEATNTEGGGSRRRRRRGRDRDRDEAFQGDPVPVEGFLDLRDEGYGFLRTRGLVASREDVYLPAKIVRQLGLRKGDSITGVSRPAVRNELDVEPRGIWKTKLDHVENIGPILPTEKAHVGVLVQPPALRIEQGCAHGKRRRLFAAHREVHRDGAPRRDGKRCDALRSAAGRADEHAPALALSVQRPRPAVKVGPFPGLLHVRSE